MSSSPPVSGSPSSSPPLPPTSSPPSPPAPAASPPAIPSSPPPTTPPAPPPATPSAPPPAIPSAPPPTIPSAPPPSIPSAPPPAIASAPPPAIPSAPPPAIPSAPPPATPSAPPPETPSPPPQPSPPSKSSPPPSIPSFYSPPPPATPDVPRGPPPSKPSPAPSPPSTSSSSLSSSLVVGIAVGGAVVLVVLVVLCAYRCKKKKRRPPVHYYSDDALPTPPPPAKDDQYGDRWQRNAQPPADHVIKVPPVPPPSYSPEYFSPPLPPPPPPPAMLSSSGGSGSNYSGLEAPLPPPSPGAALILSTSTLTYQDLVMATGGFSDANLLGQGGFGYVHRGILPNGEEVAVKQLKAGSKQGDREFLAEVEIISRVHHKHLVSLVGYCMSGDRRLLVYEYVPNNTLEYHLHENGQPTMNWPTRLKIALGAARGLAYLHEDCHPKIIHRDIKASNILLDYKFEAKVADFGLAKSTSDDDTHVSTRIMGTFGYMAPEYASSGKLTDKSDVFSFGVMLLELITGRRPVDPNQTLQEDNLVDWARPLLTRSLEDGNYDALVDPKLGSEFNHIQMACMIECAASCVRHSARRRPRMSQVVRALESEDSGVEFKPGHHRFYSSYGSSENETTHYNEGMGKMASTSQGYGTSEYSAPTSDNHRQNLSGSSNEGQHTREMKRDTFGFGNLE